MRQDNNTRSMMLSNYGDDKFNKRKELNQSMTIDEKTADSYEKTLHNLAQNEAPKPAE